MSEQISAAEDHEVAAWRDLAAAPPPAPSPALEVRRVGVTQARDFGFVVAQAFG